MKNTLFILMTLVVWLSPLTLKAQKLSKEETKKLKAEIKELSYSIEKYHEMKKQLQETQAKIQSLKEKIAQLQPQAEESTQDLKRKQEIHDKLKAEIDKIKKSIKEVNATQQGGRNPQEGIMFKVQIGAYKNRDLTQYMDKHPNFGITIDPADNLKKYTLGYFSYYWEAKYFALYLNKFLKEVGQNSFVVAFKDGKRVNDIREIPQGYF
ncbi:MAG: hypothetical protein NZ551_12355 [Microscillaceae bacterium]|nr:hypothetical protein [Microscillaceae bacterium]MDW8461985.1 hypothetical protein [Cytophagales bacterium]